MHRTTFLSELSEYEKTWAAGVYPYPSFDADEEVRHLETLRSFLQANPQAFERNCSEGHMTGAAVICTPGLEKTLLTHHRKLNKWLQLGGHADGDPDLKRVAHREGEEESGLTDLTFFNFSSLFQSTDVPLLFDVDVHLIPPHKSESAHFHFDGRYLFQTKSPETIVVSHESKDLKWFTPEEGLHLTRERSMQRLFQKLIFLKQRFF